MLPKWKEAKIHISSLTISRAAFCTQSYHWLEIKEVPEANQLFKTGKKRERTHSDLEYLTNELS